MFESILYKARSLVRTSSYYLTSHGMVELLADDLTTIEIEHAIANGRILERQRDEKSGEFKYRLRGNTKWDELEIVFKFAPDGRLAIITVYSL